MSPAAFNLRARPIFRGPYDLFAQRICDYQTNSKISSEIELFKLHVYNCDL
jgi:hypothetical protein